MKIEFLDALMALMSEMGIEELDHSSSGLKIHMKRSGSLQASSDIAEAALPAPQTIAVGQSQTSNLEEIQAPMMGAFYLTSAPDTPPFVNIGDVVKEGAPLYVLEVMKTLNRIVADFPCRIVEIRGKGGDVVEAGAPLFLVERLDDPKI